MLQDLGTIEVEDGVDENGTEKRSPFHSHPMAAESIAEPPVTVARVGCMDINDTVTFYMASYGWKYKRLLIENTDGRPITVNDVVTQLHDHLNQPILPNLNQQTLHKDLIILLKKHLIPRSTGTEPMRAPDEIFFEGVNPTSLENRATLSISTFALGTGAPETTIEEFWARQRERASSIQPYQPYAKVDPAVCIHCLSKRETYSHSTPTPTLKTLRLAISPFDPCTPIRL